MASRPPDSNCDTEECRSAISALIAIRNDLISLCEEIEANYAQSDAFLKMAAAFMGIATLFLGMAAVAGAIIFGGWIVAAILLGIAAVFAGIAAAFTAAANAARARARDAEDRLKKREEDFAAAVDAVMTNCTSDCYSEELLTMPRC